MATVSVVASAATSAPSVERGNPADALFRPDVELRAVSPKGVITLMGARHWPMYQEMGYKLVTADPKLPDAVAAAKAKRDAAGVAYQTAQKNLAAAQAAMDAANKAMASAVDAYQTLSAQLEAQKNQPMPATEKPKP